jgi:hypothetical protein
MPFPSRELRLARPLPSYQAGYATHLASARPDLWAGLTCLFAPFLGPGNPTRKLFGRGIRRSNTSFALDVGATAGQAGPVPRPYGWGWKFRTDNAVDQVVLGLTDDIVPLTEVTIAFLFRRGTTTVPSAGGMFGNAVAAGTQSIYAKLPDSNGDFAWRFSTSTLLFSNATTVMGTGQNTEHMYVLTAGPLGMRIFCDGQRIASTGTVPTARVAGSGTFNLGVGVDGLAICQDMEVSMLAVWDRQKPDSFAQHFLLDPGILLRTSTVGRLPLIPDPAPLPSLPRTDVVESGVDIDCIIDVGRSLTLARGLRNLGNALARRLVTPRGGLFYDPNYGLDVRAFVNAGFTAQQLAQVQADIAAEVSKDERVENPQVTVVSNVQTGSMAITIVCELAEGPFQFLVSVNALTVELLRVEALS